MTALSFHIFGRKVLLHCPVNKTVRRADPLQQDAVGRIVEEVDVTPRHRVGAVEEEAEGEVADEPTLLGMRFYVEGLEGEIP